MTEEKDTISKQMKEKFFNEGNQLPKCSNEGCNNNVMVRDWKYWSFKHYCSDCSNRMKNGLPPREGVKFHKKDYCENRDGRLGFPCPVNEDFPFPNCVLHSDHIDGNHQNNVPENLQTLCAICHTIKGMQEKDFHSAHKGRKIE